jgi:catechol-2,3-dioxygenase
MKLQWSHAVLNVRDLENMLKFYTDVLGFTISDRGPLGPNAPEIVFMSNDPEEHHQVAMVSMRDGETQGNPLNHLAFRVESFDDVKSLHDRLAQDDVEILPLSHGNTLSIYFNDPEGNGLEVFWDTPWHVQQPQGKVWDTSLDRDAALNWVEENFSEEPGFTPQEAAGAEFVNRNKQ